MGKRANRKNKKQENKILIPQHEESTSIPRIIGGNFSPEANNVNKYLEMIEKAPKREEKIRILFSTEASYLMTGFSTYLREVFRRLHSTGKFELAELASYGHSKEMDTRARQIPWKYYHNNPTNAVEEQVYNKDPRENQFGKWKFTRAIADFKPDIVLTNRDFWMDSWVSKDPLRTNFLHYWQVCQDGFPAQWEWLKEYNGLDGVFAYSWFGKEVLESQSRCKLAKMHNIKAINVIDVCQPGANIDIFKPLNKNEIKDKFGIPHEIKFVGTVMRNQPRKLFPRIIESFRIFKREFPKESRNVKLLLHTSIPDVGWNIPEVIYQCNLQNEVVFSYICHGCGNIGVSTFMGSPAQCPGCKQPKFSTPNTALGFSDEYLSWVYNLMDVYIQGSIAEGDGMPVNEAKSCGVPCVMSDYSALHEKTQNGGGIGIKSDTLYTESETMQWRDLFNRRDLARILGSLMGDDEKRKRISKEARECAVQYYNWDLTAKKWEAYLLNAPIKDRNKTYNAPIELKVPVPYGPSKELQDDEFIKWCYLNILKRKGVDDDGLRYWMSALVQGMTRIDMEKHFRSLIEDENKKKRMLVDTNILEENPMKRIENIIREKEGSL